MKKMTLSDLKSRIINNPNPIFNEELEFEEFIVLEAIGKKSIYFQRETRFLHGARFQGVTLNFEGAFFVEKLTIGDVARIKFTDCVFNEIVVIKSYNTFLSFQNCTINSIYFEESRIIEDLVFENTNINEFKSLESDFSKLKFCSSKKEIRIKKLCIVGRTVNFLEFTNIEIGSKNEVDLEYVSIKLSSKISTVNFQKTTCYNNVDFNGEINDINFVDKPLFYNINITGKLMSIKFNNKVIVKNELNIKGIIGKLIQILPTSNIKSCVFNGTDINQFVIFGGDIGMISFEKPNFQEKIIISGGNMGEIIIATNINKVLEIRPENKMQIGVFNQFSFSEVSINDLDGMLDIKEINFVNFAFPKDRNSDFSGFAVDSLSFIDFYNYGNISFSNLNDGIPIIGNLQIRNSDLGKMLFMNCDFTGSELDFVSSKISEIFLAGTSMPTSSKINSSAEPTGFDFENKRLALTQLKKVFDNRGDSLNSTKFHQAELEVWEKEIFSQDDEEKGPSIYNQNWFEKRKLKVFNWISEKLFPEYWNLNIQNLEHKKLIFSQYKKMYEGRGDTVKAIEYQGKELDVHRTILWENGGQYLERLQLSLNKYSNNFGQSWH